MEKKELKDKVAETAFFFLLRYDVWHKPRSIIVGGGKREKGAEKFHDQTQRNDNDFDWSARKAQVSECQ